jgi:hypothetical protein
MSVYADLIIDGILPLSEVGFVGHERNKQKAVIGRLTDLMALRLISAVLSLTCHRPIHMSMLSWTSFVPNGPHSFS